MAAAAAIASDLPKPKAGPSMIIQLVVLLVMTGAAAGIGWVSGGFLEPGAVGATAAGAAGAPQKVMDHGDAAKDDAGSGHGAPAAAEHGAAGGDVSPEHPMIIPLAPITTNLAAPDQTWVRMEISILLEAAPEADLADVVHQDLLGYMRSVKLHQIEGPSGFRHLKADLEDLASVRSAGKIKHVLIRTLLFE